jgi:thymidylate synthase ThyX
MKEISAKIVADSFNEHGCRITTFMVMFPRFILAEFNTHRMLSRNSASSRARPFKTMLKDVTEDPFVPIRWMAGHKGMQGTDWLEGEAAEQAKEKWLAARDAAVAAAIELDKLDVTKQFVNRLLEPFLWHEVIVTATDFSNFFALRAHPDAEIHICKLANAMLEAYNASTPRRLAPGEWHIPFDGHFDAVKLYAVVVPGEDVDVVRREIACARCARLSYRPFGSEDAYDYAADRKLFKTLVDSSHMSPLEHCARSMTAEEWNKSANGYCGNFRGFIQYRKMFAGENRQDARIIGWCSLSQTVIQ